MAHNETGGQHPAGAADYPEPAGIPQFAGAWPQSETDRVGRIAVQALGAGTSHGQADAESGIVLGSFWLPEEMIRSLSLSGEDDTAYRIAAATYIPAYTRTAYPDIPPPADWRRHGRYVRGQEIVTRDGRSGRMNGRAAKSGDPRVVLEGAPAAVTVPRAEIEGPVIRIFPSTWATTCYVDGLGLGTLQDGDVLWIPAEHTAAVMYRVWPIAVSGHWISRSNLQEWQGGPDALVAADQRYASSVEIARSLIPGQHPCCPGDQPGIVSPAVYKELAGLMGDVAAELNEAVAGLRQIARGQ